MNTKLGEQSFDSWASSVAQECGASFEPRFCLQGTRTNERHSASLTSTIEKCSKVQTLRKSGEDLNDQGSSLLDQGSKLLDEAKTFFRNLDTTFDNMKRSGLQLVVALTLTLLRF